MRGRCVFVTGTDTGVGKTFVSLRLVEEARRRGLRVAALKAAESGCARGPAGLVAADDDALFTAAGAWQPLRCPYLFEPAVAPGVAADDAGVELDFGAIVRRVEELRTACDLVVVEGAGGWLVPMGRGRTVAQLARAIGAPVVAVARATLGTINHAALTAQAIDRDGARLAAIAMSVRPEDDRGFAGRNAREIERLARAAVVLVDGGAASSSSLLDRLR
jgi:dethiobiotin synthetase